jgi:hypothetical protein
MPEGRLHAPQRIGEPGAERPVVRVEQTQYLDGSNDINDFDKSLSPENDLDRLQKPHSTAR